MAADAVDRDGHGVDVGVAEALDGGDRAGGNLGLVVQGDDKVGAGKFREQTCAQHRARADDAFLGGLADHDERAVPLVAQAGEQPGGAGEDGHVQVVAAGVHDGHVVAGKVGDAHFAGVGQAGFLGDGQGVELGADHQRRAAPVFEHAHHAGAAEVFCHREASRAKFGGDAGGSVFLHQRKLRVTVQVLVERIERCVIGVDFAGHDLVQAGGGRGVEGRNEQGQEERGEFLHGIKAWVRIS